MQGAVDLAPQTVVAGRYRLLAPLARGGTSSVWRAVDAESGDEVAIKILRDDDGVDPALRSRAEREAAVLTDLSHPNLVTVLDSGEDDGRPFIVMALLDGEPLTQIIADRRTLPVDEAVQLVADVADGLGAAHVRGVIHRDVKPGNIVCHEQVPTLVDFGIARAVDATTLTRGLVLGTASYLAPEQAQGMPLTPAADVYSLACVLYELLTGRPPFDGASPVNVALKHVQDEPVPPADVVDVPAPVNAVLMDALAKDPQRRPADGDAFATALRAAIATEASDETISIAPATAAVRDPTMVMPPVLAAAGARDAGTPDDDLIDSSPLATVVPAATRGFTLRPATFLLAWIAVVAIIVLVAFASAGDDGILHLRTVPDVTNASAADATRYLEGAGFEVDTTDVATDAPAGTVVASDPASGSAIPAGGTVHLSVSRGPAQPTTTIAPEPAPGRKGQGRHKRDD